MTGDLTYKIVGLAVVVFSIALHEFGHAAMSTKLGDPVPRAQGRLTLNPVAHFDPIGFLFIAMTVFFGFGIGWGRPVQTNPMYYKEYRKGIVMTAMAGPAMNLCLACFGIGVAYLLYLSRVQLSGIGQVVVSSFVAWNLGLMFFNLLPIPPLDGGHLLQQLFPRSEFVNRLSSVGILVVLALVFFRVLGPLFNLLFSAVRGLLQAGFGPDFVAYLLG